MFLLASRTGVKLRGRRSQDRNACRQCGLGSLLEVGVMELKVDEQRGENNPRIFVIMCDSTKYLN